MTKAEVRKILGKPFEEFVVKDTTMEEEQWLHIKKGESNIFYSTSGNAVSYSLTVYFDAKTGLSNKAVLSSWGND